MNTNTSKAFNTKENSLYTIGRELQGLIGKYKSEMNSLEYRYFSEVSMHFVHGKQIGISREMLLHHLRGLYYSRRFVNEKDNISQLVEMINNSWAVN